MPIRLWLGGSNVVVELTSFFLKSISPNSFGPLTYLDRCNSTIQRLPYLAHHEHIICSWLRKGSKIACRGELPSGLLLKKSIKKWSHSPSTLGEVFVVKAADWGLAGVTSRRFLMMV
jgi:hypothetical protein